MLPHEPTTVVQLGAAAVAPILPRCSRMTSLSIALLLRMSTVRAISLQMTTANAASSTRGKYLRRGAGTLANKQMKCPSPNIYLNSTSHGRSVGANFITNLAAGLMVFVRGFCNYIHGKSDGRTLWVSSSVGPIIWDGYPSPRIPSSDW